MEYVNGYHPLFQLARLFTWLRRSPILTASLLRTTGYFWAMLTRQPRAVPPELIEFLAREQKGRLWSRLKRENG